MKCVRYILFLITLLPAIDAADEEKNQAPLTRSEASVLIKEQMRVAAQREQERLQSIKTIPALETREIGQSTPKIILRRLNPKPWPVKPIAEPAPGVVSRTEEEKAAWRASRQRFRTLQVSATVFDRKLSEIHWRKGELEFTVLSNVDFNYLSMIGWLESGQTYWSTFFFVSNVDSEQEQRFARMAEAKGRTYIPRPVPDGCMLESGKADYVIYAGPEEEIPADLFEEMDALHQHYAANEQALKVAWQNRQLLNAAQLDWQKANPPAPRDTVINFWPIRSRVHGKN